MMIDKLPSEFLDEDGSPTVEWLDYIENYIPDDTLPIDVFIKKYLYESWWMPDWGIVIHRAYSGKQKIELHTGGWSGNEDIIRSILKNRQAYKGV